MQDKMPLDKWTEDDVGSWLRRVGIKECYISQLKDEEVTGPVLRSLRDDFLRKKIGMKSGQIELLLSKREQLLKTQKEERTVTKEDVHKEPTAQEVLVCDSQEKNVINQQQITPEQSSEDTTPTETLRWSLYRTFDQDGLDFRYIKHNLLPPETGPENMLKPCHEYKSLEIAQTLDSKKLQIKVAREVLRFACACMNMRANGTIHFGVMDKVKGLYKHGEIIGINVQNREDFVDALDYIEKCFNGSSEQCDARECIRNPRFIEVIEKTSTDKKYVVEYDVVPKASIVKEKYYSVGVPNFSEKANKIKFEAKTPYCRVGANTPQISHDNMFSFIKSLIEKDKQREEAESTKHHPTGEYKEDQRRKLSILLTSGRKHMDNSLFYIIVTNKFHPQHLEHVTFLVNMNTVCVFDFDPDSFETGLCSAFRKQKAVTPHFLNDYLNEEQSNSSDFSDRLGLFEKPSWIFCNGRNEFHDKEEPCDDKTWIKKRKKKLKKAVSFICNELLPSKSFIVLFMLMSDVEQPLVETFSEFYEEKNGHESIVTLSESKEIYRKWSSLAQVSCDLSTLNEISVTGMPLSHMDATVQSIQLSKNQTTRRLPASSGGVCALKSADEAMLRSLEIISVDQCENTNLETMDEDEINKREKYFYHGGKIDWINFWLSDKHKCGDIIKRDAFHETNNILERITSSSPESSRPIESVTISHQPGSGGSTVARQLLWSWKDKVRCAVVKQCKDITTVSEHAVKLRQHEERDQNNCLPVLLLLEDQKTDDIDNLRRELRNSITTKNITSSALCFILLICNRSNDPERACRISPSKTVAITHKLSENEKPMFYKKHKELERQLDLPDPDYILTFVLLIKECDNDYIVNFVRNTLAKIDHSSTVTHLIRFVALMNSYVENSHLSVSHCEAFMGLAPYIKTQYHEFVESLSEEAKLLFVDLRDNTTQLSSIRITHKVVAEELLKQLSNDMPSAIAKDLITNNLLINHRFGRDEFLKFIKTLVIRRNKKSRGDPDDTDFSPLIKHITQTEGVEKAIELMTDAYNSLGKDGLVAQQLARLLYTNHQFKEALEWAEKAKSSFPYDTFVLDTLGQVYKRWFYHLFDSLEEEPSPEGGVEIISTALKAISAFRDSEKTPKKETVSLNSSYYGEVDVGCRLLKFLSKVDVFANQTGKSQLMDYLLTDHIPDMVKKPWQKFHSLLKGLQKSLLSALELISEDLCYFQTYISAEDEELDASDPEQLYRPREWLTRKSKVYADFFCNQLDDNDTQIESVIAAGSPPQISQFHRQMMTYKLEGGNVTSIMSLIYNKDTKASGDKLERIFDMYNPLLLKDLDPEELERFIFCQIALNCIKPGSTKLMFLEQLKDLFKFCSKKVKYFLSTTGPYLASLLFWPETDTELSPADSKILLTAIEDLQKLSEKKMGGKRRTVDHFYFGKAKGLNKIVHKSVIEKQTGGPERKEKWLGGEVWKTPQVTRLLKRVDGWTENGRLFVKCGDKKIRVSPRYSASLPLGNENVTFYLGFSFAGVVASDIQVKE
ncbi:sterile alpha motif domain-containing protein 9-like [Eucyclogobius newberryi]|uniref:sterile alpha motif domain-containing protein 9-like n=1 Tax=Eucyclogobius newberryi TaxID=166745 RepID=UPI003B5CB9B9